MAFITITLDSYYAPLHGTGMTKSKCYVTSNDLHLLMVSRIRQGLNEGSLAVPGEHWPTFVYEDYAYDSSQPLKGLFRSSILVRVSALHFSLLLSSLF